VAWEIEFSKQVHDWIMDLDPEDYPKIAPALDMLAEQGPALGRPVVAHVKAKRHNLKEVRSSGGNLRILFAFDPDRTAILLLGGDKTGAWNAWYKQNIPVAEDLFDRHLAGEKI